MNNVDLLLYECGDGGDLLFQNGDLQTSAPLYQQPYLSWFGGNSDGSDFWGDKVFHPTKVNQNFKSNTEKTINTSAIDSSGRNKIKRSVDADLQYLSGIADLQSDVSIEGVDKIRIDVKMNEPSASISIAWDVARGESIEKRIISRDNKQYIIDPQGAWIIDPSGEKILIP